MALFFVPAEVAQKAGVGSGIGPSESGFYAVDTIGMELPPGDNFKEGTFRLKLRFETGDESGELLSLGYDGDGRAIKGITDEKAINRTKFINGILVKLGYTAEQLAGGYTDEWFLDRGGFVEWHAAGDLGTQYGKIARWIDQAEYDKAHATGRKPLVARAGGPVRQGAAPTTGAAPTNGQAHAGAPATAPRPPGAPTTAPAGGRVAPRPPAPPTSR